MIDDTCVPPADRVDDTTVPHTRAQAVVLSSIEAYQRAFAGRPSPCRFFPSCSAYAHEAVAVHGTRRGTFLALRRLLRCRPLGPSGFDPVPEPAAPPESRDDRAEKGR
jgi:putative membrane protein insertion efficiency factor